MTFAGTPSPCLLGSALHDGFLFTGSCLALCLSLGVFGAGFRCLLVSGTIGGFAPSVEGVVPERLLIHPTDCFCPFGKEMCTDLYMVCLLHRQLQFVGSPFAGRSSLCAMLRPTRSSSRRVHGPCSSQLLAWHVVHFHRLWLVFRLRAVVAAVVPLCLGLCRLCPCSRVGLLGFRSA